MKLSQYLFKLFVVYILSSSVHAGIFQTPDQAGAHLLQKGEASEAAQTFENPLWRGVAQYRAGDYENAANTFKQDKTARGYYNLGNAYAHLAQYEAAIDAYEQSLLLDENNPDAKKNIEIMKKLLKKSPPQKSNSPQQTSSSGQSSSEKNKENEGASSAKPKQSPSSSDFSTGAPPLGSSDLSGNKQSAESKPNEPDTQTGNEKLSSGSSEGQDQKTPEQQKKAAAEQTKKQAATDKWLSAIPDDPGGLLKQKFLRDHQRQTEVNPS